MLSELYEPPEPPYQVINPHNGWVHAKVTTDGKIHIFRKGLLERIQQHGVLIPPPFQEQFGGRKVVRMDEDDFPRAFIIAQSFEFLRGGYRIVPDESPGLQTS